MRHLSGPPIPLGPRTQVLFDECHLGHPCTRNIPPVDCCLAPERPNPSRRAMDVNDCCITTRLHGTDGRVPSGEQNVETYSLPAKFPSIERRAGSYITAPLVAAFTKQGAFCLFHESPLAEASRASQASKYPLHPLLKKCPSLAPPVWIHFSCFMGEVAHCRFTRQHASGQLTAGRYPPVSVDVALAAALDRQRWAERTAKSTGNVWATQETREANEG